MGDANSFYNTHKHIHQSAIAADRARRMHRQRGDHSIEQTDSRKLSTKTHKQKQKMVEIINTKCKISAAFTLWICYLFRAQIRCCFTFQHFPPPLHYRPQFLSLVCFNYSHSRVFLHSDTACSRFIYYYCHVSGYCSCCCNLFIFYSFLIALYLLGPHLIAHHQLIAVACDLTLCSTLGYIVVIVVVVCTHMLACYLSAR